MKEATAPVVGLPWEFDTRPSGEPPDSLSAMAEGILERCRGEGPANCVARCPLHVDARGYVQLASKGQYREALQLVRENLPFPGIMGYICTHPCEAHCKRIDDDEAIRIRDIKRFLADWEPGDPQHLLDRSPQQADKVTVVGSGPAGLMAAHDLCRAGHAVTLIERQASIGGCLVDKLPEFRLPRRVTERDLSVMSALPIDVVTGVELGVDLSLEELSSENGAVLLFPGFSGAQEFLRKTDRQFRRTIQDTLWGDPLTGETGTPGLFVGGDASSGPGSVIQALALGRRVAESARRHMAGDDLREGREHPLPARLLWSLDINEEERVRRQRHPVMLQPFNAPLSEDETHTEAERCLDCTCGLCVQDCEFLTQHCDSPKDLARKVLKAPLEEDTLKMVYSCNVCTLCSRVCPENLDTGTMLLEARRQATEKGKGPLPQHKPIVSYFNAGVSGTFSLVMPEPGRTRSKRLFFTGCGLPATSPRNTIGVYDQLRRLYPGTGVLMYCCGAPVELLGMEDTFSKARDEMLRMARSVGAEELIPACPDCAHLLKEQLPELKVTPLWEMLAGKWEPPHLREGARISIHDSCKARHEPGTHDAVRQLIEAGGGKIEDIDYARDKARCCGFGGMIYPVDAELSQKVSRRRGNESELPMITYCAGCRMALAGCGKESVHILDFLNAPDLTKAARAKPPGALGRYWNRLRTKWAFKRLRPLSSD